MDSNVCVIEENTGAKFKYYGADEDDVLFCETGEFASTATTNP